MEKSSESWLEWIKRMIRDMTVIAAEQSLPPQPPKQTTPPKIVELQPPRTEMPYYNQEQLRVKRKSLAAETQIIRDTELKWKYRAHKAAERQKTKAVENAENIRQELYHHRVNKVRPEARKSHLTDAFLRGLPYVSVEQKAWLCRVGCSPQKFWRDVAELAWRFSGGVRPKEEVHMDVVKWRNAHPGYRAKDNEFGDMMRIAGDKE